MQQTDWKSEYGFNVVANGRNWNALKLLTGLGQERMGHRLTAVNIQLKPNSVLIILKKDSPKGAMIAFLEAKGLDEALWVMASMVKAKRIPWKPDKWRSTRNDKT